jgi:hypothetical protein
MDANTDTFGSFHTQVARSGRVPSMITAPSARSRACRPHWSPGGPAGAT